MATLTLSTALTVAGFGMQAIGFLDQQDGKDDQRRAMEQEAAARRDQAAAERRIADMKAAQAAREQVRAARIKSATIANTGATVAPGSSGVLGGTMGVQQQLAYNQGFAGAVGANNDISYDATGRIADARLAYGQASSDVADANQLMGFGSSIFASGGGFKTIFGGTGGTSGTSGIAKT